LLSTQKIQPPIFFQTTTDFLSKIYEGKDYTVITDPYISIDDVIHLINQHDCIIMCGHGSPEGLYSKGPEGFIINERTVPYLKNKKLIAIWCNADVFMNTYDLDGFYTGMFISEVSEAMLFGLYHVSENEINKSNDIFASIVGKHEYINPERMFWDVWYEYPEKIQNDVAKFNQLRIYLAKSEQGIRQVFSPKRDAEDKIFEKECLDILY